MSVSTGDVISRVYGNFRGADFRGEEINLVRSPDCLNVWKDYTKTESIRTRPVMKLQTAFSDTIYGIYFYKGVQLVHSGTKLYKVVKGAKTEIKSGLNEAFSNGFVFEDIWYFKDGKNYWQYDGTTFKDVVGKIPITSIGRKAEGGGTVHEDINMISDYRINTFLGDDKSRTFLLDTNGIDDDFVPEITVNGSRKNVAIYPPDFDGYHATVKCDEGTITFDTYNIPPAPETDGQDNIVVKFKKKMPKYREAILKCNLLQVFDNRVFVSGNKDYPNVVWHCSLNDPTYFSDLDYYREGMDSAQIKGIVAGNNALWVFREPSEANTNVFYHTPSIDDEYGKVYPSSHSSITIGCVGKAINFNDDIVFFSERGMEGISGDVTTEQVAAHRSSLVDRKMIASPYYKDMVLEEWEGYLFVFIGNEVFLADSRTAFTNENHIEYEWWYWNLEQELGKDNKILCSRVYDGVLYVGTDNGIYTFSDPVTKAYYTGDIESYWVTPKDKFKAPQKLKTTNKRGCVVEAEGDISLYAKIEDSDFELIGTYENIEDYFVSRIKRKKWKDIQLKFYSKTRFSLETATLECFVGGYIKR